ncbi:MAG TPA: glucose-6-phosphate dehydrogenase [Thermodesulfobacteriota bacterium]
MVIFGATGDLTRRMLAPALYNLARERLLPLNFSVVGVARRPLDDTAFRRLLREGIDSHSRSGRVEAPIWESVVDNIEYLPVEFGDASGYRRLANRLAAIDRERGTAGNRIFYLATPPSAYPEIVENLGAAGLGRSPEGSGGETRLIVEKPFGHDLDSARRLNARIHQVFEERQVFRIDHYLGKETVQNLLFFRFANGIFEPIWNRRSIDHVQITVAESIGVEGRGGYYEEAGALKDIFQNHLLQLLALTAMEPPVSLEADAVRNEKVKVLRAVRPLAGAAALAATVRGQYGAGYVGGRRVPGYREETRVAPDSSTETFAAARFEIDSWRWAGVPFYLRTGKRLPRRVTEIAVVFEEAPLSLFTRDGGDRIGSNVLVFRIQPDEGIALRFAAKQPGFQTAVRWVTMDFRYGTSFGIDPPDAYERLLLDAMLGDATLFTREDEVEAQWRIVTPIEEAWRSSRAPGVPLYEAGSWGPPEADAFIERDGRVWRRP